MSEPGRAVFQGSLLWRTNVTAALFLTSLLGFVLAALAFWTIAFARSFRIEFLVILGLGFNGLLWPLLWWGGKLAAAFPTAVELGDRLVIRAPFLSIPVEWHEVESTYASWVRQGFVIKLRTRKGLLRYIVIHWCFGPLRSQLVNSLRSKVDSSR